MQCQHDLCQPQQSLLSDPFQFSHATVEQLDAGSQFWVYIGHGPCQASGYVRVDDQQLGILDSGKSKLLLRMHDHPSHSSWLVTPARLMLAKIA